MLNTMLWSLNKFSFSIASSYYTEVILEILFKTGLRQHSDGGSLLQYLNISQKSVIAMSF